MARLHSHFDSPLVVVGVVSALVAFARWAYAAAVDVAAAVLLLLALCYVSEASRRKVCCAAAGSVY